MKTTGEARLRHLRHHKYLFHNESNHGYYGTRRERLLVGNRTHVRDAAQAVEVYLTRLPRRPRRGGCTARFFSDGHRAVELEVGLARLPHCGHGGHCARNGEGELGVRLHARENSSLAQASRRVVRLAAGGGATAAVARR